MNPTCGSVRLKDRLCNWRRMALADIPPNRPSRRFDSWKEIADYLGRDVRTATRWEAQGLPVHRIPGGRGTSVFALSIEIDAWMAGSRPEAAAEIQTPPVAIVPARRRFATRVVAVAVAAVLMLSLAGIVFVMRGAATANRIGTLRVTATQTEISLTGDSGVPRVIYRFQPNPAVLIDRTPTRVTDLNGDGRADILTGISFFADSALHVTRSGELLNLSATGDVRWRFAFDDVLAFGDGAVRGPWAVTAWEPSTGTSPTRIAVAGHDYLWWASMVAVIDHSGHRQHTFVNPGWIESLMWLGAERLAVAGFNNPRNEAMLAVINPDADGQAPGSAGTSFACANCSSNPPQFYATFPRSELNLVTGSPFNRAEAALVGDRLLVTTSETGSSAVTALYEFDRELRFVRARYSEAYWDAHGRLEREGSLTHTRAACPERDGPRAIHVWDAAAGQWQVTIAAPQIQKR